MRRALLCASCVLLPALAGAAQVVTVGEARVLMGQHYFNNAPSALAGNLSLTVAPSVKFSERFTLIPLYAGAYRGAKEVNDLAGGDTLFQDAQTHAVSVKGVYAVTPALRLKAGAGYRAELLRETRDEDWGKGLFDYAKASGMAEAEWRWGTAGLVRAGVDLYTVRFPNYASLESSATAGGLGRELAGTRTLDSDTVAASVRLERKFGALRSGLACSWSGRAYPQQPVVLASGDLSGTKRADTLLTAAADASLPLLRRQGLGIIGGATVSLRTNDSNQAHYDARKLRFIPDYYDQTTTATGIELGALVGARPWRVTVGCTVSRQTYAERLAQDAAGDYRDEKVRIDETVWELSAGYPIRKGFTVRVTGSFIDARSNMSYEKTFAYNYQVSQYLMGFSYAF